MTAEERLTVKRPEDILGFIPHVLGYWPEQSLVALTLQGKSLGATLRVDLPSIRGGDAWAGYADKVRGYLQSDEKADGVLLAVFSDEGWQAARAGTAVGADVLYRPLLRLLEDVLFASGLPVRDAWLVGPDYWRGAYCTDDACCPQPGRPVEEIRDSRLNAEMVFRGSVVLPGPGTARPEPACIPVDAEAAAAEERCFELLAPRWRDRDCFDAVLRAWRTAVRAAPDHILPPDSAAFLRSTLRVPPWRDAVVVMAAAGLPSALAGAEAFGFLDGESLGPPCGIPPELLGVVKVDDEAAEMPPEGDGSGIAGYGEVLLGLGPSAPDWAGLEALEHVLEAVGGVNGGEATAACLTLRGWIEWCRGRGSFADGLYRTALRECAGYRLAELLQEVLRRGTLCGWARRPEAAWRRFGTSAA